MRDLFILILFFSLVLAQTAFARTVEVEVHGMTCVFCVDSLERKFGKMESVYEVQVSLKTKKVRLKTDGNRPDFQTIEQTILDAGFTPIKIYEVSSEQD
jgi:periplasmic mercuric ion binding protein